MSLLKTKTIKNLTKGLVLIVICLLLTQCIYGTLNKNKRSSFSIDFDLNNDKNIDYIFSFQPGRDNHKITQTGNFTEKYKYMDVYKYVYEITDEKKADAGHLELTFKRILNGDYVFFIDYYSNKSNSNLFYDITIKNMGGDYHIRTSDDKNMKYDTYRNIKKIQNKSVNYIEADRYIKLMKTVKCRYLGYSVSEIKELDSNYYLLKENNDVILKNFLNSNKRLVRTGGIISLKPLVNWQNDLAYRTVLNMDIKNRNLYFTDGDYKVNYYNYFPRAEGSYHKNPSALLVKACKWVLNQGGMFKDMGIFLMYAIADSYNDKGYIPTQPKSEWLEKDFNIGYGFYDTRFNSDSISSLIAFYHEFPDEQILAKINKYIDFFKKFYYEKSINIGGIMFTQDYSDYSGYNNTTHCSLNHFIAEAEVLYEYYELTKNKEALDIARKMVDSIRTSCNKWIRPDGDLWYKVMPDGEYLGDDYPLVTYNDLNNFTSIIKRIENDVPAEIIRLKKSKTNWVKRKGYLKN